MKYLKVLGLSLVVILGNIFIATFLMTILNYFNIIESHSVNIIKIIILIISFLMGGIIVGKKALKKGWLEGLKLGVIMIFIASLFNYLGLDNSFEFKNLIYYLIILSTTILGSMIGINMHKQ